ncbi:hypothetical protein KAM472_16990 [Aeromonas caviae]|nr:hypothetical protein KAM479c_04650 [Aeromonas caviae]GJA13817.1 hypothetical protein KAM335_10130 [Aeromonas caviae]GJA84374.1 hypothetical protein KAM356_04330 [Aeromonas caviae]GJA88409.1 hypothetical protein KAM357_03570 [Aeromonas caviae]GJB05720.1 hypothetical protein KAM361_03930 [Aeromonas caviae]
MAGFDGAFARSFIGAMCELSHAQAGPEESGHKKGPCRALRGSASQVAGAALLVGRV